MIRLKYIITLLLLFLTSNWIFSQSYSYKNLTFEHLSIEHGLSQITVHSILQDTKGFLWFGTEDGLNRYDGYKFEIYRHDASDTNSISDNFIWSMFEDSDKNIWVGTNSGGLNKYSYSTNSFTKYLNEITFSANNIRVIFEDSKSNLWVGTNNSGLFKYDKISNRFDQIVFGDLKNLTIRSMCEDSAGVLWIGTDEDGLIQFDFKNNEISYYNESNSNLTSNSIWALISDAEKNIWIGTYNGGLVKYNIDNKKFQNIIRDKKSNNLIDNNITSLILDNFGNPWIGTEGGLTIYDRSSNEFISYRHNLSDLRSMSNSFVRTIIKDDSDLIWFGTVGGGINKVNLNKKFNQYNHNPTDEKSLSHNMIRALDKDSKGNIWIGTLGNGINRFDKNTNNFERFNSKTIGLSEDVVTSIYEDNKKHLWVGTWGGGLNKIKLIERQNFYSVNSIEIFKHDPLNNNSLSSDIVQDIFEDSRGNLWIGTEDGLDKFNRQNRSFEHYKYDPLNDQSISDNRIQSSCIIEDRFGYLWVGTWQGLNRLNIRIPNDSIQNFESFYQSDGLSDNRIISIYEDQNFLSPDSLRLWVGTIGGGLNKLSFSINNGNIIDYQIEHYSKKDGLPSNVIYGILGDEQGSLWLSTNNGISKFDLANSNFRNYNIDDGLQSNQFFWGAAFRTDEGELFFGGINGLNSFYPTKLTENKNIPPVFITKCIIESTDGETQFEYNNLEEITSNKGIELPYDNYNIQFEFTALDLTTPKRNRYKYILENYDEKWIENSYSRSVNYTSVNDGEYVFKVLGSNNDGLWNNVGAYFNIVVQTPFWKTWWFILLVVSAISGMVIYFVITQIKNLLAVERLRTKLAADLHDNIGSSLTEISILSEVISTRLKSDDKDVVKNLDKISTKSRKLIDKMSDIVWLVNPQRDSLYDLILRLQDTYSDLLADTEISFRCENLKSLEKVSLLMEHRQHLFLVFKEAINNSITHSNCTELLLNANVNGRVLTMVLEDNGDGFESDENIRGNGLKNMKNRSKKISGKLIINSQVGKGTVVKYIGNIR